MSCSSFHSYPFTGGNLNAQNLLLLSGEASEFGKLHLQNNSIWSGKRIQLMRNTIGEPEDVPAAVFFREAITMKAVPVRFARCAVN